MKNFKRFKNQVKTITEDFLAESKIQIERWKNSEILNQEQYQEVLSLFNQYNDLMKIYKGQLKNIAEEDFYHEPQKQKEFLESFQFSQWFSKNALQGQPLTFEIIKNKLMQETDRLQWYHENAPTEKRIRAIKSASKDYVNLTQEFSELRDKPYELLLPLDHVASGKIASAGYKGIQAKVCVAHFHHFDIYINRESVILYLITENEKLTISFNLFKGGYIEEVKNHNNGTEYDETLTDGLEDVLKAHLSALKEIHEKIFQNNKAFENAKEKITNESSEQEINALIRKNWKFKDSLISHAIVEHEKFMNVPNMKHLIKSNPQKFLEQLDSDKQFLKKFQAVSDHINIKDFFNEDDFKSHKILYLMLSEQEQTEYFMSLDDEDFLLTFYELGTYGGMFNADIINRVLGKVGYHYLTKRYTYFKFKESLQKHKDKINLPRINLEDYRAMEYNVIFLFEIFGYDKIKDLFDFPNWNENDAIWAYRYWIEDMEVDGNFKRSFIEFLDKKIQHQLETEGYVYARDINEKYRDWLIRYIRKHIEKLPEPKEKDAIKMPALKRFINNSANKEKFLDAVEEKLFDIFKDNVDVATEKITDFENAVYDLENAFEEIESYCSNNDIELNIVSEIRNVIESDGHDGIYDAMYENGYGMQNEIDEEFEDDERLLSLIEKFEKVLDKHDGMNNKWDILEVVYVGIVNDVYDYNVDLEDEFPDIWNPLSKNDIDTIFQNGSIITILNEIDSSGLYGSIEENFKGIIEDILTLFEGNI